MTILPGCQEGIQRMDLIRVHTCDDGSENGNDHHKQHNDKTDHSRLVSFQFIPDIIGPTLFFQHFLMSFCA